MAFSLTWLPEVLEDAGLKVAEQPGWRNRGRSGMGTVRGVICHHTAGPANGNMPSLGIVTDGRDDLAGPLAQLCLGRDGTFFVVAAGRANHAGPGAWHDIETGNSSFIGIEAENTGRATDPWPEVQMDAYRRGVAAILKKIGADAEMVCGHKEYALPPGRKPDPTFDMDAFRAGVAAILGGSAPAPVLIPATDGAGRPTLRRGAKGEIVKALQRAIGVGDDGDFGPATEAALRQFQRRHGLVPDGIAGPKTWAIVDGAAPAAAINDPIARITRIAADSAIARFGWADRGRAPIGYIKGMALTYARVHCNLLTGDAFAADMARADSGDGGRDALAWYHDVFAAAGMHNGSDGADTLRHLFVLLVGLGMRESSGRHCEGRDVSAANTTAETAEAGLFQTSFNARTASPLLPQLFARYRQNPSGFLDVFAEGVTCSAADLQNFGAGDGREFQQLSKDCPAFAAEFTAVALRHIRTHWGPITRRAAQVRPECDEMLRAVQEVVDTTPGIEAALR